MKLIVSKGMPVVWVSGSCELGLIGMDSETIRYEIDSHSPLSLLEINS